MSKIMNAVFTCRDNLENKEKFYGFIIYKGHDSVVEEIFEKMKKKLDLINNEKDEPTLCQIQKMKKEFQATRKILSNLYGFEVSDIKSQSFDDWKFEAFFQNDYTREEFDKMQEQAILDDIEEG